MTLLQFLMERHRGGMFPYSALKPEWDSLPRWIRRARLMPDEWREIVDGQMHLFDNEGKEAFYS